MKIDDLKANARLVLKGPLALQNFKVGEVSIVDAVGTENILFRGGFAIKRDVVLERFVTEPEWKEFVESTRVFPQIAPATLSKLIQVLEEKVDRMNASIQLLISVIQKPIATDLKVEKKKSLTQIERSKGKKEINVSDLTLRAIKIFIDLVDPITEEDYLTFGNKRQFTALQRMMVIEKVIFNDAECWRLSPIGKAIPRTGRFRILNAKRGEVVQCGLKYGSPGEDLVLADLIKDKKDFLNK